MGCKYQKTRIDIQLERILFFETIGAVSATVFAAVASLQ
jgi:hypothetical protein